MIDLSGDWTLADVDGEHRVPMRLPGDAHTALQAARVIPDPYLGRNEYDVRWVGDRDWTATRDFVLPDGGGPWLLVLDGLDTVAEVRLNDDLVLKAATSFREHVVSVTPRPGVNRIAITFRSNTRAANALQASQPFPVPHHAGNSPIPNGNMLRKAQCDFGWDWNLAIVPFGVVGRIALIGGDGEIAVATITQRHEAATVEIEVKASLRGFADEAIDWRMQIGETKAEGRVTLADGAADVAARLTLRDPALWWPNGSGPRTMHTLRISAGGQTRAFRIALRELKLVAEPDAAGLGLKLRVNGRDVFARGANWIPADALAGRITEAKTRDLLTSAAAANMNMIRVWGGGRYEPESFYEACDDLGLLVWQDFMFSCNLYPATPDFLAEVGREAEHQAARLAHRVAIWCGDNELIGALTWFKESIANRDRYLVAYDRLNRTIEAALKRILPDANWWPSSPSPGPLSFGDTWHDDSSGDMHFWSVWHEGRSFEHYRDVRPRFCSEFGFQSYTSTEVIRSFAVPEDMNIASPVMESHQKNKGGNARIAETMFRYFRFPEGFENFVWLSRIQQALAIKTAVEFWRSLKPHCMGALYWQLNDTWPVQSWSSLDYGGGWKPLHHFARRFFQPVTVAIVPKGDALEVTAVNDTLEPVQVEVEVLAATMDGVTRPLSSASATVGPDAALTLAEHPVAVLRKGEILVFRWRASNGMAGGDHYAPVRYKELALRAPRLRLTTEVRGSAVHARVGAESLALFVTLEADRPGRFSENTITLIPGQDAEIAFTPGEGFPSDVRLTFRDLHSSFAPAT